MSDTDPAPPDRGAPASSRRKPRRSSSEGAPPGGRHPFFGGRAPGEQPPPEDTWWTRPAGEPQQSHPFWGDPQSPDTASAEGESGKRAGEEPSLEGRAAGGFSVRERAAEEASPEASRDDPVAAGQSGGNSSVRGQAGEELSREGRRDAVGRSEAVREQAPMGLSLEESRRDLDTGGRPADGSFTPEGVDEGLSSEARREYSVPEGGSLEAQPGEGRAVSQENLSVPGGFTLGAFSGSSAAEPGDGPTSEARVDGVSREESDGPFGEARGDDASRDERSDGSSGVVRVDGPFNGAQGDDASGEEPSDGSFGVVRTDGPYNRVGADGPFDRVRADGASPGERAGGGAAAERRGGGGRSGGERAGSVFRRGDGLTDQGISRKGSSSATSGGSGGWPSPEEWREQRRRQRESVVASDDMLSSSAGSDAAAADSRTAFSGEEVGRDDADSHDTPQVTPGRSVTSVVSVSQPGQAAEEGRPAGDGASSLSPDTALDEQDGGAAASHAASDGMSGGGAASSGDASGEALSGGAVPLGDASGEATGGGAVSSEGASCEAPDDGAASAGDGEVPGGAVPADERIGASDGGTEARMEVSDAGVETPAGVSDAGTGTSAGVSDARTGTPAGASAAGTEFWATPGVDPGSGEKARKGRKGRRSGRKAGRGWPADGPDAGSGAAAAPPADPEAVARAICLRLLTMAPKTRAQLAEAMRKREVPDEVAESVLDRFTELGLINDEAFAEAWVDSRHHGRGLAKRALANELRHRGVDQETVKDAVERLDPDQEEETARRLVERKLPSTRSLDSKVRTRRLAGMLARKGYPPGLSFRVIREALEQEGVEVEDEYP
ncbi:recombination regulator RecX [Nonomuraea harbinensis]|uniref:Regulatory protein RecX n=1 Tax=Nonomuraea harbinensis TaxID=1286938 RepID=A0ABW1BUA6_9ACTN|nr:recombination regulator RecX [Nonomuraea harbinensis]